MQLQWFRRRCLTSANPRTARPAYRPRLECLEDRITPATVNWIGGSGDWAGVANWRDAVTLANRLPGPSDDAVIDVAGITATHTTGTEIGRAHV